MATMDAAKSKPTVFISYAHESEALRGAVKKLADWLTTRGCAVLTDHDHVDRAPSDGWPIWMQNCIREADTVLVVCTPKLKARYEKQAPPDTGRGATFEGAIVTQHIYDNAMRNTKFFPVLPDGGLEEHIPTTLKSWWNRNHFPSGYEGIHRLIFSVRGMQGADSKQWSTTQSANAAIGAEQERLAARLLGSYAAQPFFAELQREFAQAFRETPVPQDGSAMVAFFAESSGEQNQVQELFFLVRLGLKALEHSDRSVRAPAEEAAVALYWVAACRWVREAAQRANVPAGYFVHVPRNESVIYAVIATALFGGELRVVSGQRTSLPSPEFVFEVRVPAGGDQREWDFERAAYQPCFPITEKLQGLVWTAGL
jgi:hypothetical protein